MAPKRKADESVAATKSDKTTIPTGKENSLQGLKVSPVPTARRLTC